MDPQQLRYTESHEWASLDGDVCTVGLTQFAVDQLGDIVHLELPEKGRTVSAGGEFGVIESYKSANDLYSPVDGEVAEVNGKHADGDFSLLASDPFGDGWLIKVKVPADATLDHLMSAAEYQKQIESEEQ